METQGKQPKNLGMETIVNKGRVLRVSTRDRLTAPDLAADKKLVMSSGDGGMEGRDNPLLQPS